VVSGDVSRDDCPEKEDSEGAVDDVAEVIDSDVLEESLAIWARCDLKAERDGMVAADDGDVNFEDPCTTSSYVQMDGFKNKSKTGSQPVATAVFSV
jgi:hypothetical protein